MSLAIVLFVVVGVVVALVLDVLGLDLVETLGLGELLEQFGLGTGAEA